MLGKEWNSIIAFSVPYLKSYWFRFAQVFCVIIIGAIVSNAGPMIWGEIIDCLMEVDFGLLIKLLVLYSGLTLLTFGLGLLESYLGSKLDYEIESNIRRDTFTKALNLQCKTLDGFDSGELISRVTSDSSSIISFVIELITSIVTIVINICASLFFAIKISPQLSIISIAFIPLSIASNTVFKHKYRILSEEQKKYGDRSSSFLVNVLGHIPAARAFNIEGKQINQYDSIIKEGWNLQRKSIFINNQSSSISMVISCMATFFTITMSAFLILKGSFSVGNMVSFQSYISKLSSAISQLLQMNYSAQSTIVAVDRIKSFLSMPEESKTCDSCDERFPINSIAFQNVTFAYKDDDIILNSMNFSLSSPGIYAFVGENGCGKTTILKLLMKYYGDFQGNILINGISISKLAPGTLRHNISYCAKDIYIQNDTLLNNLVLGSHYMARPLRGVPHDVIAACQAVGLSDFIDHLPLQYDTVVGEDGKMLSSGQKQKISLVRAMLSNASLFLFDEITSDMDGYSEKEVMQILEHLGKKHLIILVSHRINTVTRAKKILMIQDGQVAAQGSHEYLLKHSDAYCQLFAQQETKKRQNSPSIMAPPYH